jgi:hypothetical protein
MDTTNTDLYEDPATPPALHWPSPLEQIVTQYDIFKRVVGNLTSVELFRLAMASKFNWAAIRDQDKSWNNFNKQAACDGYGVRHRAGVIRPQVLAQLKGLTYDSPINDCAAAKGENVESKPCVTCDRTVCNECRTHAFYNAPLRLDPPQGPHHGSTSSPDPSNYSIGLIFFCDVYCIVDNRRPAHNAHDTGWFVRAGRNGVLTTLENYHDTPYRPVEDFISAKGKEWSAQQIGLVNVRKARYRSFGGDCFKHNSVGLETFANLNANGVNIGTFPCQCSVRSHYLDRWLCMRCGEKEKKKDLNEYVMPIAPFRRCPCGVDIVSEEELKLCRWCGGLPEL